MSRFRRFLVVALTLSVIAATVAPLAPQTVDAHRVTCRSPIVLFNRYRWCGYFHNIGFDHGDFVRDAGVPGSVNTAQEFINLIRGDLSSGDAHRMTSAKFVILTMLGRGPGLPKSVTPGQISDWEARVRSYANISENGSVSRGESGTIEWFRWERPPCQFAFNSGSNNRIQNTYYQVGQDDVASYLDSNCGSSASTELFLLFRGNDGVVDYRIRRECMNPMGILRQLEQPQPDEYNLTPFITPRVDGAVVTGGVEIGQTIQFTYSVRNDGTDPSPANTNCTIYTNVHNGYALGRSNPAPGGGAGPPTGCPRSFAARSSVQLGGIESVVVGAGNQTICRSLFVSPATANVAMLGTEICIPVVNKPYFKVYGGDLSAGNGHEGSSPACVANSAASVIGWNRGNTGGYAGAGVQFGVFALHQIYEVASSSGNSGVNIPPMPRGFAFAGNSLNGSVYGGDFGSLPCIPDYYAAMPDSPMPFTSLNAANISGAYEWKRTSGLLNLSGRVADGKRITLYVEGDVLINGDIRYPDSWNATSLPLFQLVVKGNIYIRNTVSRIDGVFMAQHDGATGGTIFTCAIGASALPVDGNLHGRCNSPLTINGAFVANDVSFLRTRGTKHQASAGEPNTSGNIAEIFNFTPAIWMAQPTGSVTGPVQYDSITALPPTL